MSVCILEACNLPLPPFLKSSKPQPKSDAPKGCERLWWVGFRSWFRYHLGGDSQTESQLRSKSSLSCRLVRTFAGKVREGAHHRQCKQRFVWTFVKPAKVDLTGLTMKNNFVSRSGYMSPPSKLIILQDYWNTVRVIQLHGFQVIRKRQWPISTYKHPVMSRMFAPCTFFPTPGKAFPCVPQCLCGLRFQNLLWLKSMSEWEAGDIFVRNIVRRRQTPSKSMRLEL
eukprot:5115956-Amphidinium_carterae.1